jgi:hypothetical protein
MKKLLNTDSYLVGAIATLVSELLCAGLLWIVLLATGTPLADHVRWFVIAFVPPVLLLRYYAKEKAYPATLRATITTFFITLVVFMWFLIKYKHVTF